MSNSTHTGQATNPICRADPHSSDQPDLAEDPLLRNGSFIDATTIKPNIDNNVSNNNNNNNYQQQEANVGVEQSEATPLKSRRKVPVTMAPAPSADSANWLPPGWLVEDRVRASGATAGTVDKYYIEPVTGRRFRSKKEVQYFLETGTKKKTKRGMENSEGDVNFTESPGSQKSKKASKNAKVQKRNFDYLNVPDRIEWALIDANQDAWTPFLGGQKVAEYDRQNWDFEMLHLHH
ncbi:methyl-CpG-binding domain-containing protein 5 [Ricinus communis]|uniref:DNA binding protein, putative n=1 Tax=Ricinus communis TaxID=3988 RepID=B9T3M7_RICCO|nr:methyl-CpG-binding domain-containing protein 5 [Ricinus communis]EEF29524.1 DNA binding protein, putative [Ricinus communis]